MKYLGAFFAATGVYCIANATYIGQVFWTIAYFNFLYWPSRK